MHSKRNTIGTLWWLAEIQLLPLVLMKTEIEVSPAARSTMYLWGRQKKPTKYREVDVWIRDALINDALSYICVIFPQNPAAFLHQTHLHMMHLESFPVCDSVRLHHGPSIITITTAQALVHLLMCWNDLEEICILSVLLRDF